MARIRIGTCSWLYPSWEGLVYSSAKPKNALREYATRYDTVEIDRWFWSLFGEYEIRLPEIVDAKAYRQSVSDDFRFTIKVPNSITLTHCYLASKTDPLVENPGFLSIDLFERFLARIEPLHDVLGPLLFQFEYLNRNKMVSQKRFLDRLAAFVSKLPSGFSYAVEIRNNNYLDDAYFDFLAGHQLAPVLLHGYWMPPVAEVVEKHARFFEKIETAVIRLHGPDRGGIEEATKKKWNRIVAPKDVELDRIAAMIRTFVGSSVDVYLNVNNHYEGSAPLTIKRIRERLSRA